MELVIIFPSCWTSSSLSSSLSISRLQINFCFVHFERVQDDQFPTSTQQISSHASGLP